MHKTKDVKCFTVRGRVPHGKECPHSKTSYCTARLHLSLLHAPPKTPVLPFLPLKLSQDGQSPEFAVVQREGQRELLVSEAWTAG